MFGGFSARTIRFSVDDSPDAMRRTRGPQKAPTKRLVSLRLSPDVLDAYRGTGRGWQARINTDLERAAKRLQRTS